MSDPLPTDPPTDTWPAVVPAEPAPGAASARPRVVTVVGVLSLVVAFLGVLGAAGMALWAFMFYATAHSASAAAAREASVRRAAVFVPEPPRGPLEAGPDGLTVPLRQGVVDAFNTVRPLRPQRIEQLDAILARHGRPILVSAEDRRAGLEPSPERVRGLVVDHGELFSANRANAPEYFQLATGRLELYDDRSVFYPADGSRTLRSSLPRPATQPSPVKAPPAPAPTPSTSALVVVLAAVVAGAALSVLLFVAGVLWLRGLPSGRRLHLAWASLKIATVVTVAIVFWWMVRDFSDAFARYVGASISPGAAPLARPVIKPWQPLAAGIVGVLYPLAVLIVLRAGAVRTYFRRDE